MRNLVFFIIFLVYTHCGFAFEADSLPHNKKRLNVVLSNKASRPDPAMMSFHSQAWWNQLFHKKKFRFIIANTADEAVNRISNIMEKENALIGNIWFDSHGHMGRRVSLLELGDVELNYQSIKEPWIKEKVAAIGKYCDSITRISLGSCYSGAGYYSAGTDSFPQQRMNGDSLMKQMAEIMNHATVYGSVSWITTKPGLFRVGYATAGSPEAKKFKDPKFRHAWDSLGIWKSYTTNDGFRYINTLFLDPDANIKIAEKAFLDLPKNKKKQQKNIRQLEKGNFKDDHFHKYKNALHVNNGRKKYSQTIASIH
jgi:hypothetical protein